MKIGENRLGLENVVWRERKRARRQKECQFRSMECARSKSERRKRDGKGDCSKSRGKKKDGKKETEILEK